MTIDIRQLRQFIAVATEGGFTRASLKLNITQPPLTRAVRSLEAQFGLELIDREVRPLGLTSAGEVFLQGAKEVVEKADSLETMMRALGIGNERSFVIGFVQSMTFARLPELIRTFRARCPDLDVRLIEMNSIEQLAALKERRINAGFGRLEFSDSAITQVICRQERLMVAVPANHPLSVPEPANLCDLRKQPMIIYPSVCRPSFADKMLALIERHELRPSRVIEADDLRVAMGQVASGAGLCIVPESVSSMRPRDVLYRPILDEGATVPVVLSLRADDRSSEQKAFSATVNKMLARLARDVPNG